METRKIVGIGLLSVMVFSFWASILYGSYMRYEKEYSFSESDYGAADRVIIKKDGAFKLYVESADLNDSNYVTIDVNQFVFAMYNQQITQPNITANGEMQGSNLTITITGDLGCYDYDVNGPSMVMCSSRVIVKINRNLPIQLEILNNVGDLHLDIENQTIESIIMKEGYVGSITMNLNSANVSSIDCGGSIVGDFNIDANDSMLPDIMLKDIVGNVRFYTERSSFGYLNYSITGESRIELSEVKLNAPGKIEIKGVGAQRIQIIQNSSTNHNLTIITKEIVGDVRLCEQVNLENVNLLIQTEIDVGDVQNQSNLNYTNGIYQKNYFDAGKPTIYMVLGVSTGNIYLNSF
jgi:hypothetical protein